MRHYEENFIRDCCRGNKVAEKRLFDELYAPMFRVVYRYISHTAEAEDCVMKGFMKVYQNLHKFQYLGTHSLFAWVRRIMVNEALMFLRQNHNLFLSLETNEIDIPVESGTLDRLQAEELNTVILALPAGYRTVFNLYVVEGYDHKQIAEALGISESTSRTQLAKAKNKLRIILEQKEVLNGTAGN